MLRRTLARRTAVIENVIKQPHPQPHGCQLPPRSQLSSSAPSAAAAASSSSSSHHDLPTFLSYAKRSDLDTTSSTYAGTYYEYLTQTVLRRYGFALDRVGGRGDRGIDLKGTWTACTEPSAGSDSGSGVGSSAAPKREFELPVMIQCKRLKAKAGPNLFRELQGALAGRRHTLGVLVSTRGATRGVREAMGRAGVGLVWVCLESESESESETETETEGEGEGEDVEGKEEEEARQESGMGDVLRTMQEEIVDKVQAVVGKPETEHDGVHVKSARLGRVRQMLWNKAASEMGLQGLDVVMKYAGTRNDDGEAGKEVVLMWQGKVVAGLDDKLT